MCNQSLGEDTCCTLSGWAVLTGPSPCVGRVFVSPPNDLVAAAGGEPKFWAAFSRPQNLSTHFKTTSKRLLFDLSQNAHVAMRIAVACVTAMWCAKPSVGCKPPSGSAAGAARFSVLT